MINTFFHIIPEITTSKTSKRIKMLIQEIKSIKYSQLIPHLGEKWSYSKRLIGIKSSKIPLINPNRIKMKYFEKECVKHFRGEKGE